MDELEPYLVMIEEAYRKKPHKGMKCPSCSGKGYVPCYEIYEAGIIKSQRCSYCQGKRFIANGRYVSKEK